MTFIRKKYIKGNVYYYEQRSIRINGKIKSVHVRYLGTTDPSLKTIKNKYVNKFRRLMLKEEFKGAQQEIRNGIFKHVAYKKAIKRTDNFIKAMLKNKKIKDHGKIAHKNIYRYFPDNLKHDRYGN